MRAAEPDRRVATVKIGGLTLTGPAAWLIILVLLAGVAALVWYERPSARMLLSAAVWIAFIAYWSAAARDVAAAASSEPPRSRALHQTLLNTALVLLFLPVPGLRWRFPPRTLVSACAGLGVQAAFTLFAAWARLHLGRNWSGEVAIKEGHRLVRSGPYRIVRHPIYTAMLGMSVGTTVVSGELHAWLGVGVMIAAYVRKIRIEERALGEAFGEEYEAYRNETWALIPGVY